MGIFSNDKEIQKAFDDLNATIANNQKQLMYQQKRLLKEIDDLKDKIAQLERTIEGMAVQQVPAQPQQPYYDAPMMAEQYVGEINIDTPAQGGINTQPVTAPAPFYAIYQNNFLQPIEDDLKMHAHYYVVPTDATNARVEFNRDCISTYIQNAYVSMTEAFDCDTSYTKNPRDLQAQDTSTAHMQDGAWVLDKKIRLLFV